MTFQIDRCYCWRTRPVQWPVWRWSRWSVELVDEVRRLEDGRWWSCSSSAPAYSTWSWVFCPVFLYFCLDLPLFLINPISWDSVVMLSFSAITKVLLRRDPSVLPINLVRTSPQTWVIKPGFLKTYSTVLLVFSGARLWILLHRCWALSRPHRRFAVWLTLGTIFQSPTSKRASQL